MSTQKVGFTNWRVLDVSVPMFDRLAAIWTRYQECIRYIRNNDTQSAYAAHILNNIHEYGPINSTISLPEQVNKGPYINFIVLHSIPIITNLTPNNVLENATQFTNLYIVLSCVTLARCLCSNVVLQRILYLSMVPACVEYVNCPPPPPPTLCSFLKGFPKEGFFFFWWGLVVGV